VFASPLLPGITDGEGDLEAVGAAAHEAGAQWFTSGVTVFDAVVFEVFHAFFEGEISTPGGKIPAVVCPKYLRAGGSIGRK